jgi:serine-type D-Ala-D-Ala carboxypeptidase
MSLPADGSIDNILLTYLHKNTFSGCAVGFSNFKERGFKRKYYYKGKVDNIDSAVYIDRNTLFDLASLTKPLVTVLCLLALKKERKLVFEDKIARHLPFTLPDDKKNITILDLIRHTSGLPAHRPYYKEISKSNEILDVNNVIKEVLDEELISEPGDIYLYSDLDYIILGYLIEKLCGESIGSFWQRKISEPLGLSKEFFWQNGNDGYFENISFAVTGFCSWTGAKLCGKVHDDNCRAMDRLSGHAGLFGTLSGVLTLCEEVLLNYSGRKENTAYDREDLMYLLRKRKRQQWAYGFDVPTGDNPSSGKFFSKKSIGHLGFTGTSFWIDLDKDRIVVVLTNRVLCGEDTKNIKEMRPLLHDALLRGNE